MRPATGAGDTLMPRIILVRQEYDWGGVVTPDINMLSVRPGDPGKGAVCLGGEHGGKSTTV
jgi:hypothetical protein